MITTNYARVRRLPKGITPYSISIFPPAWWSGRHLPALCPAGEMLQATREEYDAAFRRQLDKLNPHWIWSFVRGESAALVCYEPPNVHCHRRLVAEWFEASLGVEVTELGFPRSAVLPYARLPAFKPEHDPRQLSLF